MLKLFRRIFLCEKWVILILCTALGNILSVRGVQELRFSAEPSDLVVVAGRSVTLDCVVEVPDDSAEFSIKWRGDDHSSYFDERDPNRLLLSNGSLFIRHVTLEDQGSYQCVAFLDSIGSMASRMAQLQVAAVPPTLGNQPQDLRVFPGQTAHFSCVLNGPLKYSVTWLKDERPLNINEAKMVMMPSGSLEIDDVDTSDQGSYRCNASSSGVHKLSNKAVLTMNTDSDAGSNVMAPIFITKPKSIVVKEGDTVVLDCAANGNPRPWLMWLKDGVAIDMADLDGRFFKLGTGSLQIVNIREKDAGNYQCRAGNREDSVDAPATIDVQVPPRFIRTPQDTVAYEKEDVELGCQVYGKPDPKVQWLKNGEVITVNDYLQYSNGYSLRILGLMQMDAGIFQCIASNPAGNIQTSARLTVLQTGTNKLNNSYNRTDVPHMRLTPSLLKSEDENETEDEGDDYEDIDQTKEDDYDSLIPFFTNETTTTPKTQKTPVKYGNPLKKSPQYLSSNDLGTPDPSKTETSTFVDMLPSAPRDLEALIISNRFVTLSWQPPVQPNGEITTYSVYYRQEGSQRERVLNTSGTRLEEVNVPGLQPARLYHFRVVAHNAHGPGASSEDLEVKTDPEVHVPGPPINVNARATSPTSIYVEWKPPAVTNGAVSQYQMFYMEGDSVDERYIMTPELSYEVSGLRKYTEYSVWVIAHNANGPGSASEEITIRTLSDVPSEAPQNVTVEAGSSTSVIVRWEPPPKEGQNGVITGYKLRYKKPNRRNRDRGDTVTVAGDRRLYALSDLDKSSVYQIRLWAMNNNGSGPPTEWYTVETYDNDLDETQVPGSPSNLIARPSSSSIRVSWGPPKDANIMVRGYTIGWGKGVPDIYTQVLEGKQRTYNIEELEVNSEYVISLRAYNEMGDGRPAYVSVRTREDPLPEPQTPLIPPVGLKAIVLSSSTVVLYWTDTSKNQNTNDGRHYSVKYTWAHHSSNPRPKYFNTTDLNCMLTDLRPNTQYEFSVKVIKGRRESKWSMVVFNTTFEAMPSSPPRDLTIVRDEKNPTQVILNWQPPKQANGQITGYVIYYTTDYEQRERDWIAQNINGDKLTASIKGLQPSTTYYFKIQGRNSKGAGPLSLRVPFTTGEGPASYENNLFGRDGKPLNKMIYIILACSLFVVFCVSVIIFVICCKRHAARKRSSSGYLKGTLKPKTNVKPPDLWIHHDQMELKALEKSHHSNSDIGPSSSGSQMNTLGRTGSNQNDFDHTNSLDKRTYLPSYVGTSTNPEKTSTIKRSVKPKPISLPMEPQPIAQPVMSSTTGLTQSPGSELGRPLYPRTQYRAHITLDSTGTALENPYSLQGGYDSIGSVPPLANIISAGSGTYSSGGGLPSSNQNTLSSQGSLQPPMVSSNIPSGDSNGTLGKRQQGHPLKSFSVPAPPPQSAPSTPQQKHVVRPMQGSSPYKKPGPHGIIATGTGSPSNAKLRSGPGTAEETTRLQPSYSTEELNQEMLNLEGLMKDLNAITASEFEC